MTPIQTEKRQKAMAKLALVSLIGAGFAMLASNSMVTEAVAHQKNNVAQLKPKVMSGKVIKTLEEFSFISSDGMQYHVYDPNGVLDQIAKKRGQTHSLYELERIKIKGIVSKVGNYGHMGRFERQITIVE